MPATVPGLRRDNVDVSRARTGERKRARSERTRERKEVRYWLNSRACLDTLMSFRCRRIALDAMHTSCIAAVPNFYCGRKWIFTLCRESLGFLQPIFRGIRSTRVSWAHRIPLEIGRVKEYTRCSPVYILNRGDIFPCVSHSYESDLSWYTDFFDRQILFNLTLQLNYNNRDEEIERL